MAKIRVYELAKKLNMTNKALLTKLKAMNIEVKSHMSSLEDEEETLIRKSLFGQKNKQADTRVKPSVIRRRKPKSTKAPEKSVEPEVQEELAQDTATPVAKEEEPIVFEKVPEAPKEEETAPEVKETTAADSPEPEPVKKPEPKGPAPEKRAKNKFQAAKIIQRPVVKSKPAEEPEKKPTEAKEAPAPVVETEPVEAVLKKEEAKQAEKTPEPMVETEQVETDRKEQVPETPEKAPEPVKVADEKPKPAEKALEKEPEPEQKETAPETKEVSKEPPVSETEVPGKSMETAEAKDKKRKKKKVQKRSTPAKIIKMAVPIPVSSRTKSRDNAQRANGRHKPAGAAAPGRRPNGGGGAPGNHVPRSAPGGRPDPMPPVSENDAKRSKKKEWKKKRDGAPAHAGEAFPKGARKRKSVVEGKDLYERRPGGKKGRKKDARFKKVKTQKTQITVPKAIKRRIKIDETIELAELAKRMGIKANEMIVKLMGLGVMATVNQTIDFDTATLVAAEFDYEVEKASVEEDIVLQAQEADADLEKQVSRSPVVTIMGHVDHGKTSLLDEIRKSKIATGEAGGITQHIGAYSVETPSGTITFLDTPGHAAFTSMRSRGAQVTDLVVLVVAADDGVMPQTIEAINHSKAAGVPVVVAVNKMDKPGADPDRVTRELAEQGLLSEEWGGDVIFAKVSAKTGDGISELLEMILLQAEVLELKANPDRLATGNVIESRLDAGRGPVATILVNQGTLKAGQPVVCGLHSGKIRVMIGDIGQEVKEAGPSTPVEIVGLSGVPEAGDEFVALESEKDAKHVSDSRMQKQRAKILAKRSRANLEKLFESMGADEVKELKLIVKADVHGSIEALNESIMKLEQDEVSISIVHSGTGAINESDVSLAAVSDAIIIGFNVRPTPKVRTMAKDENVDMRFYDIIYNVINDIKAAITGLMPSTFHEKILGRAEVRDTFVIPHKGLTIGGAFVLEGKIVRGQKVRLLRDGVVKCDTTVSSLRRFKDDVKEVAQGYECGIGIERYNDIKIGDIYETYEIEERKAQMEQIEE